jgi:hypothetical protein
MPFPDICVEDRECCPNEIPTLCFQQQTQGTQQVQLRNKDCEPYALDPDRHEVCFVTRDLWLTDRNEINKTVPIIDGPNGIVEITLFEEELVKAGIWLGELVVFDVPGGDDSSDSDSSTSDDRTAIYRFKVYLQSEENLTNTDFSTTGLTIAEVRLAIRDRCREDNFLLDNVEFSNTEIAWAIRRPVDFWNEIPPPLNPTYTAASFPYRYHWIYGVIGELMNIAAINYERNRLQYAAANLSVDDKDKANFYKQSAEGYLAQYRQWVLQTKKALNMNLAYNSTALRSFGNRSLTFDNTARNLYY